MTHTEIHAICSELPISDAFVDAQPTGRPGAPVVYGLVAIMFWAAVYGLWRLS
jgi:hypothetical protein